VNATAFLQIQSIELQRLLDSVGDDPILAPQLRERLAEVQDARQEKGRLFSKANVVLPRVAIFLRGAAVEGSDGIRASLAGEALIQYEKMFVQQALHDEREAAKNAGRQRRKRGASSPELLFTNTPRGSFGLEFSPRQTDEQSLLVTHGQSLRHVADAIVKVIRSDDHSLEDAIRAVPARVLQPLRQFLKTLSQHGAELRLALPDAPSVAISAEEISGASERLEREVTQETIKIRGVFRGVTRESGVFDIRLSDGSVITGTVADDLTEDDLERIDVLTNQQCIAELQKTTVNKITGVSTPSHVLLDAKPSEE
jgi:hypothetical protein